MSISASGTRSAQSSEFQWGQQQVLALINSVEEFFEDFYDGTKKKKMIWNAVAERMKKEGHHCTGSECDKKWRNLKGTYIKVLQKQVNGDTSYRFEYFDALHHILGREIDPLGMREQALTQGVPAAPDNSVPEVYHEITNDKGFIWTNDTVHLLLDHILEYQNAFSGPPAIINTVWEDIARQLSQLGQEVTSSQCQRKWLNLQEGLQFHQARAEAMGTVPLWAFYTRIREVTNTINVITTIQMDHKPEMSFQEESRQTSKMENIPSGPARTRRSHGRSVLARIKHIESNLSIKQRLERLEARVETSRLQQEAMRNTNTLLAQALAELRRINTALKQEGALQVASGMHAGPPDPGTTSPNQEFIIVEAYTDQL